MADIPPGLILVHGNQPEALRDLVCQWLRAHPLPPLQPEVVLVQSNGMAQWLRLALAAAENRGGHGIAAGLEMLLPSRFLWQIYRTLLGNAALPAQSLFDKDLLQWRLLRLLPELLADPAFTTLGQFLADDSDDRKRYQLALRLADQFDQYQVYRADWLAAWQQGEDVIIRPHGKREAIGDDQRWQPILWRKLLEDSHGKSESRAVIHQRLLAMAAANQLNPLPGALPPRVVLFGLSTLPRQAMEVMALIARWSQVIFCIHNPCEHYWGDIVPQRELLRAVDRRQSRRHTMPAQPDENTLHLHAHPLLAAWGKQGRDFIAMLDEFDDAQRRAEHQRWLGAIGQRIDLFLPADGNTLLSQLQNDILDLRPPHESRQHWPAVAADDRSITFHIAHSPQREVEILHDQLLAAFAADATLEPRQIIVMVPDIHHYAPHIHAVFGLHPRHDARAIPFAVADERQSGDNRTLQALAQLLTLPQSRLTLSDLLDLLELPLIQQRFAITANDLPTIANWLTAANVRWGLHGEHRKALGLTTLDDSHTLFYGVRRLLLGYAVGQHDPLTGLPWHDIEPCAEVGGFDAALAGRLIDLINRLEHQWRQLNARLTPIEWQQRLLALLEDLFLAQSADEQLLLNEITQQLQGWTEGCELAGFNEPLPLAIVRSEWLARLEVGGLSQRFLAGRVTFATLMPMRAIPFRHLWLLGMNDGDYPRQRSATDFDLMAQDYRPGDRSRREDDRYLFLEALLAARERLAISWVGRRIVDNIDLPPSLLVSQLRDHLGTTWRRDDGKDLLASLTRHYPLQPFSQRYFDQRYCDTTYAHEWQPKPADAPATQVQAALPPLSVTRPIDHDDLRRFIADPVSIFLSHRLGIDTHRRAGAIEEDEPLSRNILQNWQWDGLIHDLLQRSEEQAIASDEVINAAIATLARRGEFAHAAIGRNWQQAYRQEIVQLGQAWQQACKEWPERRSEILPVTFEHNGLTLNHLLANLRHGNGYGQIHLIAGRLLRDDRPRATALLQLWCHHLLAQLAPFNGVTSTLIATDGTLTLSPLDRTTAGDELKQLLTHWQQGMCRPLPFERDTALLWIDKVRAAAATNEVLDAQQMAPNVENQLRKCYQGDEWIAGRIANNTWLRRIYPTYDTLTASGEFFALASDWFSTALDHLTVTPNANESP
jgi:exodeoxyribonuclease V gamma subunit